MEVIINKKNFLVKPQQSVLNNKSTAYFDNDDPAIVRDENKCIACGLCQIACKEYNNLSIPVKTKVGQSTYYRPDGKKKVRESKCTRCGQCVNICPTGTLSEQENILDVESDLKNQQKIVIAQIAPSVRVSVSESFGLPPAQNMEGKIVSVLKKIGFDYVFDVNLGADFTTVEEIYDLKERIKQNKIPLFTSCCPARVKYIEDFHPHLIPNITNVRSPQQCLATIIKTYFAKKERINPKNVSVVSIMPCLAKKFESRRQGENKSGSWDIDWVLTTRELIKLIKNHKIDLKNIKPQKFDNPLGESSGAGAIYGASGGVMESALRSFAALFGKKIINIDYKPVRGMEGIKKATVEIDGKKLNIAVASTLANAEKIFKEIKNGAIYHYVEVMACPGGCVGGGGQPKPVDFNIINKRREALYNIDKNRKVHFAHENPTVKKIYKEYFGCPGSEIAKKYLHTHYNKNQVRICNR
ncbi:MAG: [FeFe] hydrogenase, group A [Patescibacteria group bacterium]|nr:[FeFe] hydrogenase, group A [Patescibacteria group bacterium]